MTLPSIHRHRSRWAWWLFGATGALLIAGAVSWILITAVPASQGPYPLLTKRLTPSWEVQQSTAKGSQVIAIRQKVNQSGPILFFFPATGARTNQYVSFEQTAAQQGYHVIAVPYANLHTERSLCTNDPFCYGDYHQAQLSGQPPAEGRPRPKSSIDDTILSSIRSLEKSDPQGQWGVYLHNNSIRWSQAVVAGHSQGGGVAAYIAHIYAVKGVIMLSSPNDIDPQTHTIATWLTSKSATPINRYLGFLDTHDVYAYSTRTAWKAMFGPITTTSVDATKQYTGRFLATSIPRFPDRLTAHFAVAQDKRYVPAWSYLLDHADEP